MRRGKRILAVIPARGGSKGIPNKNISSVAGKPLISYTTELLKELPWIDSAVVSTDSAAIADVALGPGTVEIVWRPEELSGDNIGDMPVLAHALATVETKRHERYEIVVMLQPTSPLRAVGDVEACVDSLLEGSWSSVWTVSETDLTYHPQKQVRISSSGAVDFYLPGGATVIARQQLEPAYHRNGVCYSFTADFVKSSDSVFSPGASAALITPGRHISIDTPEDLREVTAVIESKTLR